MGDAYDGSSNLLEKEVSLWRQCGRRQWWEKEAAVASWRPWRSAGEWWWEVSVQNKKPKFSGKGWWEASERKGKANTFSSFSHGPTHSPKDTDQNLISQLNQRRWDLSIRDFLFFCTPQIQHLLLWLLLGPVKDKDKSLLSTSLSTHCISLSCKSQSFNWFSVCYNFRVRHWSQCSSAHAYN